MTNKKANWELKKGKYDYPLKYMVDKKYFDPELHEDIKIKRERIFKKN